MGVSCDLVLSPVLSLSITGFHAAGVRSCQADATPDMSALAPA